MVAWPDGKALERKTKVAIRLHFRCPKLNLGEFSILLAIVVQYRWRS
jgi:hypothetical protein